MAGKPDGFTVNVSPGFADIQLNRMPLLQIFVNLVTNAIKHHHREDGSISLGVEDNGRRRAGCLAGVP